MSKQSIAKKALKLARKNTRAINKVRELHFDDFDVSDTVMSSTPQVSYMEISPANLDGRDLTVLSIQVRGEVRQNLASALADNYRIDLVYDSMPTGANITPLEFYKNTTAPGINSFKDFELRKRFRIIRSWTGLMEQQANVGRQFSFFKKVKLLMRNENEQSTSIASQSVGALYVIQWTTATANQPSTNIQVRITYKS